MMPGPEQPDLDRDDMTMPPGGPSDPPHSREDATEIAASAASTPPPAPEYTGTPMDSGFESAPDLATSAPGIDSVPSPGPGSRSGPGGYGSALGPSWGENDGLPIGPIEPGLNLFGKYEVLRQLGRGGMGSVWLVKHLGLHSERALKVVNADLNVHSGAAKRFEREARAMAAFTHPNAVMVHDARPARDGAYIEMEYVEGKTLQKVMTAGQPMPTAWILRILDQLCDVLEVAHKKGIVHRDLKPANMMLLDGKAPGKEHLKVLDFGIAKILEESADLGSMTNGFLGTPAYVSPEQALAEHVDGRADLYTVGVMLFEFLSGSRPFMGNPTQLVMQHVNSEPPKLADLNPSVRAGDSVEAFVRRCLAKDPKDRPQTARELYDGFCLALGDSPLKAEAGALLDAVAPYSAPSPSGSRTDTPYAPTDPLPGYSGLIPDDGVYTPPEVGRALATEDATFRKEPTGLLEPTERLATGDLNPKPVVDTEQIAPPTRPKWLIPAAAAGIIVVLGGIAFVATRGGNSPAGGSNTAGGGLAAASTTGAGGDSKTGKTDVLEPKKDLPLVLPPGWAWPEDASLNTGGKVTIERTSDRVRYARIETGAFLPLGYKPVSAAGFAEKWPKVIARESDGVEFVYIEGGNFVMGNPDAPDGDASKPAHRVVLSGYYLQRHEVTNDEVDAYLKKFNLQTAWPEWRASFKACSDEHKSEVARKHPAVGVTYRQAQDFAKSAGVSGQLPTEAQWEYAARNRGRAKLYPWGDEPPSRKLANVEMDGSTTTEPVGTYPRDRTEQGASDVIGNVREWCRDAWKAYAPSGDASVDPVATPGAEPKPLYAIRGGSFQMMKEDCTATRREDKGPDAQFAPDLGFRVVIEIPRDLPEIAK